LYILRNTLSVSTELRLVAKMRAVHAENRGVYGSRR
jgi:hypothetical protein